MTITRQESRIKSLEQELDLFEWEFVRMKEESFNASLKDTNSDIKNNSVTDLNNENCESQPLNHSSPPKCVTDTEKEVGSNYRLMYSYTIFLYKILIQILLKNSYTKSL